MVPPFFHYEAYDIKVSVSHGLPGRPFFHYEAYDIKVSAMRHNSWPDLTQTQQCKWSKGNTVSQPKDECALRAYALQALSPSACQHDSKACTWTHLAPACSCPCNLAHCAGGQQRGVGRGGGCVWRLGRLQHPLRPQHCIQASQIISNCKKQRCKGIAPEASILTNKGCLNMGLNIKGGCYPSELGVWARQQ